MRHHDLTGRGAIHPFAFIGSTDPSLDSDNEVDVGKAWIDTSGANPILKYRNATDDGWDVVASAMDAEDVAYDNLVSGLTADDVQEAIDEIAGIVQDRSVVSAVTSSSGVVTLNYALGDYFTLTLSENVTSWVISNPPGSGHGFTLMVQITQDSTPRTVAKPGTTAGGAALDVSTGSGDIDVLAISSFDNGATLRSTIAKDFS